MASMNYPPVTPNNGANFTPTIRSDTYASISPTIHSNLTNASVFISGASRGIGLATAISYARAGASQIAVAAPSGLESITESLHNVAKEAGRSVPKILVLTLDVLDLSNVEAAAQETATAFNGKLDILINNAGYLEPGLPIISSDPVDYWRTWEINYRGLYYMTRTFLPILISSDAGKGMKTMINLSSMGALGLRKGGSSYQTSKFAILKFTEFVMAEEAEKGVLCYAVHPGGVMTELARNMPEETHAGLSDTPQLAGDTITFLTKQRREWLAGRYVSCKWDMDEFLAKEKEIVEGDKLKMRLVE